MIGTRHMLPLDQSVSGMFQNYVFQTDRSENFNPISGRIFDECDAFHRAIIWSFHKLNTHRFKTITSRIDIGNRDTEEDTSSLGYQDYKNPDQNELLRIFAPRWYCLLIF